MKIIFDAEDIASFRGPNAIGPTFQIMDSWSSEYDGGLSVSTQFRQDSIISTVEVNILVEHASQIRDAANLFFRHGTVQSFEIEVLPGTVRLTGKSSRRNLGMSWHDGGEGEDEEVPRPSNAPSQPTLYRIVPFKMPAEETDEERERNRAEAQRFDPEEWRGTPLDPDYMDGEK